MENQTPTDQPKLDHNKMLHKLVDFIGEYIVCTEEQRVILALWIMHTWTYRSFAVTPYLDIHSPESRCGKTRCLQLLAPLCLPGGLTPNGPSARVLAKSLLENMEPGPAKGKQESSPIRLPALLLLDDRDFTFSVPSRDPIFALLKSGATAYGSFLHKVPIYGMRELTAFFPKAFAGINRLPRVLADCCIPIALQHKKRDQQLRSIADAARESKPLVTWLEQWAQAHAERLRNTAAVSRRNDMPVRGPQEDALWPLLYIAETITGRDGFWATKASQALRAIFDLQNYMRQEPTSRDLLADIWTLFRERPKDSFIPTSDIIPWLKDLDHRPWHKWGPGASQNLADLLRPFGIRPNNQRLADDKIIKVYRRDDFLEMWSGY